MQSFFFKKFNFDGTTLKLALDSHNRPSLTFSTPKCYKIHQGVMTHGTASIWILCNILENIPHALLYRGYWNIILYLFMTTVIETGRFNVFL
jgi:hypothetical protein